MLQAARPKSTLKMMVWLIASLLAGAIAGNMAKQFGVPIELRVLAFAALAGVALAIWQVGSAVEAKAERV